MFAALAGLALATAACSGGGSDQATVFTLRATGAGVGEAEVSWTVDGDERTEVVALPWSLDVEVDGDIDLELRVTNRSDTGEVGCEIAYGPGSPDITGEVSATCTSTGRADGDSLSVRSVADFVDREPAASGDEAGGAGVDSMTTGPLVVSLQIRDRDGVPVASPAVGGRYVLYLVVEGLDREATVGVDSELTDGETIWSDDQRTRFQVDDVVDGSLAVAVRGWELTSEAEHRWTVTGAVFASDDTYEAPFELSLAFVPTAP